MGDQIKLRTGSNWMGDHIRSSIASNWMGDVHYYLRAYGTLILLRGYGTLVFFFFFFFLLRNYCNSTLLWPTWIKLNLMTFELNVDRFYAQLDVFSIFVISHDIGMESGSNWISWPRIFVLTDFTPNWALFSIFVILFDRGIKLGSNWNSWPMNLMLTDFTPNWALFLFSLFHMTDVWNMDEIESYDLRI